MGTAENKDNQSMENQKWLAAGELAVNLNKTADYHGQLFSPQKLLMMLFREKKRFLDEK